MNEAFSCYLSQSRESGRNAALDNLPRDCPKKFSVGAGWAMWMAGYDEEVTQREKAET